MVIIEVVGPRQIHPNIYQSAASESLRSIARARVRVCVLYSGPREYLMTLISLRIPLLLIFYRLLSHECNVCE